MNQPEKRRTSVKVTDELAERLTDDAASGVSAPPRSTCAQPDGAAHV
jgi:hypothetical protein